MPTYRCFHASGSEEGSETILAKNREAAAIDFALRNGGVPAYVVTEDELGNRSSVAVNCGESEFSGYEAFVT